MGEVKLTRLSSDTYKLSSPRCRFASFDLCYGYFQTNRGNLMGDNLEKSCLHLWSYLASWGMLRNSKLLSDCSMKVMEDIVVYLSGLEDSDWDLDLGADSSGNRDSIKSDRIIEIYDDLSKIIEIISINGAIVGVSATPTLVTKIMLGTLGCVPALDTYFCKALHTSLRPLDGDLLWKIKEYYNSKPAYTANTNNKVNIDADATTDNDIDTSVHINIDIDTNTKIKVIDFNGKSTDLFYPRAKVLDMIGFSFGAQLNVANNKS